ncbi:N-acetylglucosaminyl transferase component-domain-containing protein [Flammula alnicola]|nr:N-acetylglucosaminyl transferase component-domain-containing protein [Flammula alnicola]
MLPSSSSPPSTSTTVFWPHGSTKDGICYGWLKPAICIAGVLDGLPDVQNVDTLSLTLSKSPSWNAVKRLCGGDPTLLGVCKFDRARRSPVPTSLTLWNFGQREPTFSYVLYSPHTPDSLRFYVVNTPNDRPSPLIATSLRDPYNALARCDFTRPQCRDIDKAMNDVAINQLNAASLIQILLYSPVSPPKLLPKTATFLLSLASYLGSFSAGFLWLSKFVSSFANLPVLPDVHYLMNTSASTKAPSYARLKDISAIVQQIDVRVEQAVFFITHVTTLKRQNTCDIASYSVRYTNFFNTAWLIMNDMTLGLACGAFLSENSILLAEYANQAIQEWLFRFPREAIYWLDAWPAGLKLNTQLSRFYVNTFIGVIDTWDCDHFTTINPVPLHNSRLSLLLRRPDAPPLGALGYSILFLIVHLRIGYELAQAVYWAAGVRLGGGLLWGVFRGKRLNVLRNRTDTWSYDIDQLLFGTVLFTLLAFLFPTALVYYMLFAGLRLATLLVQASIETLLAFMHHFPLFALMLRGKDPWRLPASHFGTMSRRSIFTLHIPSRRKGEANRTNAEDDRLPSYLVLENQPITLSAIFFQYIELWKRLAQHYNPLRLLYQVLAGQHLASIPRYSMRYASGPDLLRKEKEE